MDAGAGMLLHQGFDAQKVWADLNSHQVSHISLVPAMLAQLLDVSVGAAPPEDLRVALIGGGHLSPELAARAHAVGWPLCVSYGMSETCSLCAVASGEQAGIACGDVGLPLDGFEVSLSPQGRIRLRGSALMQGYVNPDRSPGDGLSQGGWFETGDLGEIDRSGYLRVLGRADHMLISGGNTIHPVETETLLINCPGVDDVVVSARLDKAWGDVLLAIYVGEISCDELEAWCRTNLSSSQRPREFIQVPELPRNGMGKLDRKSVKAMVDQL
jgi:O-succinylbenzoic acid--CoA ligase